VNSCKPKKSKLLIFHVSCVLYRNFYLIDENFWKNIVLTLRKKKFISSKHWIKKCRKEWIVKSCLPKKSKNRKIVNFSCFLVFCTVWNFYLRHENFWKKNVPTSQKTLFISSKQWIKKCRKKKREKLQPKKVEKS